MERSNRIPQPPQADVDSFLDALALYSILLKERYVVVVGFVHEKQEFGSFSHKEKGRRVQLIKCTESAELECAYVREGSSPNHARILAWNANVGRWQQITTFTVIGFVSRSRPHMRREILTPFQGSVSRFRFDRLFGFQLFIFNVSRSFLLLLRKYGGNLGLD